MVERKKKHVCCFHNGQWGREKELNELWFPSYILIFWLCGVIENTKTYNSYTRKLHTTLSPRPLAIQFIILATHIYYVSSTAVPLLLLP